jgi:hypothetical protein
VPLQFLLASNVTFYGTIKHGLLRSYRPPLVCAPVCNVGESDMGFVRTTGQRFSTAGQLFSFFWSNKRWWLTPILITLAVFAVLLILAQSSAIAPFIYTFF